MHNKVNGLLHYRSVQTTPVGTSALHWFAGECVRRKPTSNIWGKDDGNRVSAESTPTLAWERERGEENEREGKGWVGLSHYSHTNVVFCKVSSHITGLEDSCMTMSMQVHAGGGLVAQLNCRIYRTTAAVIHKTAQKTLTTTIQDLCLCFAQEHYSEGHPVSDKIKYKLKHNPAVFQLNRVSGISRIPS